MQCFNELNSRQIGNGFNIFDRIWLSKMFIAVWVGTFGVQFVLVEALGRVGPIFKTVPLTASQHLICILFGAGSIPVGLLMRFLPSVPVPGAGGNNNAVGPARSESDRQLTTADGKVKETGEV